jgi:hypothetical protein
VSKGAAALAGACWQGGTEHREEEGEVPEHRELTRSAKGGSARPEDVGRRWHRWLLASGRRARGGRLEASRLTWLDEEEEGVAAEL